MKFKKKCRTKDGALQKYERKTEIVAIYLLNLLNYILQLGFLLGYPVTLVGRLKVCFMIHDSG